MFFEFMVLFSSMIFLVKWASIVSSISYSSRCCCRDLLLSISRRAIISCYMGATVVAINVCEGGKKGWHCFLVYADDDMLSSCMLIKYHRNGFVIEAIRVDCESRVSSNFFKNTAGRVVLWQCHTAVPVEQRCMLPTHLRVRFPTFLLWLWVFTPRAFVLGQHCISHPPNLFDRALLIVHRLCTF